MKKVLIVLLIAMGLFSQHIYSQKQGNMTKQQIVEVFLAGFNDQSKIQTSLELLAEDYHFKNPMVELQSKEAFIALAKEMGKVLTGVEVIRYAADGEWVAAFYTFQSAIPGLERNLATEWFRIENGMIQESHLIYDASAWRKVYEQMEK
ncbi:MAG: nuclear transport factor 2 family protein [Bacteroidota bacterium]